MNRLERKNVKQDDGTYTVEYETIAVEDDEQVFANWEYPTHEDALAALDRRVAENETWVISKNRECDRRNFAIKQMDNDFYQVWYSYKCPTCGHEIVTRNSFASEIDSDDCEICQQRKQQQERRWFDASANGCELVGIDDPEAETKLQTLDCQHIEVSAGFDDGTDELYQPPTQKVWADQYGEELEILRSPYDSKRYYRVLILERELS